MTVGGIEVILVSFYPRVVASLMAPEVFSVHIQAGLLAECPMVAQSGMQAIVQAGGIAAGFAITANEVAAAL